MLNYKQIWHGIKPIRWLNKFNLTELHNLRMKLSNVRKKVKEPPNMRKELSHLMVELHGTVKCEKKVRKPPHVRKELLHVMLKLHNMRMKLSNVRKK